MANPIDVLAPEQRRLRIGDAWREATGRATFPVEDPAILEHVNLKYAAVDLP